MSNSDEYHPHTRMREHKQDDWDGDDVMTHSGGFRSAALPEQITCHIGSEMSLLERACHTSAPKEILLAPVELHQRNIKRRLREADLPKEAFSVGAAASVSRTLLSECDVSAIALDRIDRLGLVEQLYDEDGDSSSLSVPIGIRSDDPEHIEQIRSEIETITNFNPQRLSAWRATADELSPPFDGDTEEVLELALAVERGLRAQTDKALSDIELIRRATRQLTTTNGDVWRDAFTGIERVSVLGLSSISAPYADFLQAIAQTTSVDIHIYCRPATGEYLRDRVPSLFAVTTPGEVVIE